MGISREILNTIKILLNDNPFNSYHDCAGIDIIIREGDGSPTIFVYTDPEHFPKNKEE